ncbi:MAG: DUF423 domain-containing protein [Rubritepida sp.]|nr:DUF423 domain-containing protein [Rubritepida sp.]
MQRLWFVSAGLAGCAAVALAAIGAHVAGEARGMVDSVAMILGWHAPALLGLGLWNTRGGHAAAALMLAGVVLFGGAVLLRAFGGISLGPVAPIGGFAMMAGWLAVAVAALRR